jgi:transcriptional regulator with XRE-family HTH domain
MPTSAQAPQGPVTATRVLNSWTGREARLLRQAMRRSVRGFAGYLGMSSRTISNWEAGGLGLTPRPDTQAMLDTALHRSSPQVRERFESLLAETTAISSKGNQSTPDLSADDLDPALPWTAARMMSSLDDAIDGKLGLNPSQRHWCRMRSSVD